MTDQQATPPPPYAPAPKYGYTPGAPEQRRGGIITGFVAAALLAGLLGGVIGAFTASRNHPSASVAAGPQSTTDTHAQDVQLCTAYATINASMPNPQTSALEVLPGVNALRLALAEAPHASPDISSAISDVTQIYDALIAKFGKVRTRGLAAPEPYDGTQAQQAIDRVWTLCQLDR